MTEEQIAYKVTQLKRDGLLDLLLENVTKDIALEMVREHDVDKRNELYQLAQAIKRLNVKLQEYTNKNTSQEVY